MSTINERIAILRKELNLTQEEFGNRLGIKKSAVSKLENGMNNPTDSLIRLIVSTYPVNAAWLRDGDEPMMLTAITEDKIDAMFSESDSFTRTMMKVLALLPDKDWEEFKKQLDKVESLRNRND